MRRPPRRVLPVLVAVPMLTLVGCGGGSSSPPAQGHVDVVDNAFKPGTVNVSVGDTVTWDFKGGVAHNVTFDNFNSDNLTNGKTYTHKFNTAGTFSYRCTIHAGMNGTVKVG